MKTALITGASDGIGEQAARQLAALGWQVAVIGRNPERTRKVAQEIGGRPYIADFADLTQVQALAAQLLDDYPHIDLLANNAGGIFSRQPLTRDGFDLSFQVNHLAPFLLTRLLLPRLTASHARVIYTASVAHKSVGLFFNLSDFPRPRRYSQHLAYGNAKLANILTAAELNRRLGASGLVAASFHPGVVVSSFSQNSRSFMRFFYRPGISKLLGMISPAQEADTLVWLATSQPGKDWQPGGYYAKRAPASKTRKARDPELANQLWALSETLIRPYLKEDAN